MKLHKYTFNYLYLLFAAVVASTAPANAVADTATELAKKTQNPVSNLISVPFENNANYRAGPDNKVLNVLNIKPVIPIKLNDNWNLINRAILPLISQPGVDGTPIGRKNGVSVILPTRGFLAKCKTGRPYLGVWATDTDSYPHQQQVG